jgi:hypothetical protein
MDCKKTGLGFDPVMYSYERNNESDCLGSTEGNQFLSCQAAVRFVRKDLSHRVSYVKCVQYKFKQLTSQHL